MDNELLARLYGQYRNEIYLYLYSLCKDQAIAEDLLQDTFLKALLALPDNHANIKAWLYMVARNLFFNHCKKSRPSVSLQECEREAVGEGASAVEKLISDEGRRLLYQSLQRLEVKKREVLLMQYFGGLSQKEIAAILHITLENARVLSYRARKELRRYLEEKGYEIS